MNKTACGKTIAEWTEEIPVISSAVKKKEAIWLNDKKESFAEAISKSELGESAVKDASERLKRFASYFEMAFPETKGTKGIIESLVKLIPKMKDAMEQKYGEQINGELLIKLDSHLPISGSIKARGSILTPKGRISVSLHREGNNVSCDLIIPESVECVIESKNGYSYTRTF